MWFRSSESKRKASSPPSLTHYEKFCSLIDVKSKCWQLLAYRAGCSRVSNCLPFPTFQLFSVLAFLFPLPPAS